MNIITRRRILLSANVNRIEIPRNIILNGQIQNGYETVDFSTMGRTWSALDSSNLYGTFGGTGYHLHGIIVPNIDDYSYVISSNNVLTYYAQNTTSPTITGDNYTKKPKGTADGDTYVLDISSWTDDMTVYRVTSYINNLDMRYDYLYLI